MTNDDDARARLRGKLDEDAELPQPWRPNEPGDEIFGHFQRWGVGRTGKGETKDVAVLVDEAGEEWSVWCLWQVLGDEMKKADPAPGDLLGIRRLDDGKGRASGNRYRRFRVAIERGDMPPSEEPRDSYEEGDPF